MNASTKVIVVGINHAGTSVIRTLLAQNPGLEVTAYDRNSNISFLGCGIALTVGGTVKNLDALFYSDPAKLGAMGARIFMEHEVVAVDPAAKTVQVRELKTGREFDDRYDQLVYAAGSWPLAIPGLRPEAAALRNVQYCKLYQHAEELVRMADDPAIRSVAVVGAGYIGIELAEAYRVKSKRVTLIDFEKRVVPRYFDTEFTDALEADIRAHGVTLALGEKVVDFAGRDGRVTGVVTDRGRHEADLVICAVGFKPNTELLPGAAKTPNGALIVDSHMRTSLPDVWAVGDCAALPHAVLGKPMQVALATNAVKSGIAAASDINGLAGVELSSVVGTNAICVFGHNLASTGLSEEAARAAGLDVASSHLVDADRPEFMPDAPQVGIKLVYEKATLRLVGAQVGSRAPASHTEVIYFLALAIQQRLALPALAFADVYFLPHYNKPFNFVLGAVLQALGIDYAKAGKE